MRINIVRQGGYSGGGFNVAGATMTGPLLLAADPVTNLEAATKKYVDTAVISLNAGHITTGTLPVGRLPGFSGDFSNVVGTNNFTLADTTVIPGTYTKVTVDDKGRVTSGNVITSDDIPQLTWSKITSDKPTTIAGYGINDAISSGSDIVTGYLTAHADPVSASQAATKQYVDNTVNGINIINTGDTIRRPNSTPPVGFLRCNGGEVSKTAYSALYSVVSELRRMNLDYVNYTAIGSGQPWRQQYDINVNQSTEISAWNSVAALSINVSQSQTVVTKDRVYLLGGHNGTTILSSVYTATINVDGRLGNWVAGTALPQGLVNSQAIVTKNRLYLIGGNGSTTGITSTVYTAPINSDGTIGAWTTGTSLPNAVERGQAFITKDKVFLIGGNGTTDHSSVIYSAPIDTDGVIGVWSAVGNIPVALARFQLITTKNRVYIIGGSTTNTTYTNAVYTAPINSDGTLGTWESAGNFLNNLIWSASLVTKNRVYLFGGNDGTNVLSTTYSAPINSDGTLGAWSIGGSLPETVGYNNVISVKNRIYLLGGWTGSVYTTSVYSAYIYDGLNDYSKFYDGSINKFDGTNVTGLYDIYQNEVDFTYPGNGQPWRQQYQINSAQNGDIVDWVAIGTLPITIHKLQPIVTKNRVYLLGGTENTNIPYSGVYTAPINEDGTLGAWTSGTSLPIRLSNSQAIVVKNRVYLIGGYSNTGVYGENSYTVANIYKATINADGTLGAWSSAGSLPASLGFGQAIITKDRIYYLAGTNNTGSGDFPTIVTYTAPVNTDGTLGTWTTGTSLPGTLSDSQAIVCKNKVYLLAGWPGVSVTTGVIYTANINVDGTLGAWSLFGNLPLRLHRASTIVTKNKVYLIGGHNGSVAVSTVYTATIDNNGMLGDWNVATSLPTTMYDPRVICLNNKVIIFNVNNIYRGTILGSLNDYSPYYDGTITPTDPGNFKLPDTSLTDPVSVYTFIKY